MPFYSHPLRVAVFVWVHRAGRLLIRRGGSLVRVQFGEPCHSTATRSGWLFLYGCTVPIYTYILQSETNGQTYVGQTADLPRRIAQHNDPDCKLTRHTKRIAGPWRLIHVETFDTRSEAMLRERALKSGKGREWIRNTLLGGNAEGC